MRWDLYKLRKYIPRFICFTRTRVNKFWQTVRDNVFSVNRLATVFVGHQARDQHLLACR